MLNINIFLKNIYFCISKKINILFQTNTIMKNLLFILLLFISISSIAQSNINKVYVPNKELVTVLSNTTLDVVDSFENLEPNKVSINIFNGELHLELLNRYGDITTEYISFFILCESNDILDSYIFQNEYSTIKLTYSRTLSKIVSVSIRDVRHLTIQYFLI